MIDNTPAHPRRWYGADQGDPAPAGAPGIELVGGPLCGQWMVLDDHRPPYPDGVALIAIYWHYPGGRLMYDRPTPPDGRLHWSGDMP
jgi:hypothetical protein